MYLVKILVKIFNNFLNNVILVLFSKNENKCKKMVAIYFNVDLTDYYTNKSFKKKWFKHNFYFRVFLMQSHTIYAGMGKSRCP